MPSMSFGVLSFTPASSSSVGNQSSNPTTRSELVPGAIGGVVEKIRFLFREFAFVFDQRIVGHLECGVRNDGRVIKEERPRLVVVDELHGLLGNQVHAELRTRQAGVTLVIIGIGA